ncbi:hypothetical protein [Saccharopolyspora flava]|nr:hypothetical protein [Saccharopolyspora flava]
MAGPREDIPRGEPVVVDLAFAALLVGGFLALALLLRGLERL